MLPNRKWWSLLGVCAVALVLAGCSRGVENFSDLDSDLEEDQSHLGVLVPEELDLDGNGIISPADELRGAKTQARSVAQFFADGDENNDGKLTKDEFAKALQGDEMPYWQLGLIALAVVVIPIPIGTQLAKSLRMPDHGWRIALILVSISSGAAIAYFGWPPNLGIDLSGGVIMIYEIDEEATQQQLGGTGEDDEEQQNVNSRNTLSSDALAQQLRKRINPGGVSEIVVRPYGPRQVEIIIPDVEEAEIDAIQRRIERTGQLEFLIVANSRDDERLIEKARKNISQLSSVIKDDAGKTIGRWVPAGIASATREKPQVYRGMSLSDVLRARRGGEFVPVDVSAIELDGDDLEKAAFDRLGYTDVQVLMRVDPNLQRNVKGDLAR